jgi:RimJ/RimL family protein N-acetyltransferase
MIVLRGDGLELRPLTRDDAPEHLAGEDDAQIRAFEFPRSATIDDVLGAVDRWLESWQNDGPVRNFGVFDVRTRALIGNVEIRITAPERVDVSYLVFPPWRRRGVATAALRIALSYAGGVLGASTATIKVLFDNEASIGVARALGAVRVGSEPSPGGSRFEVFEREL